MPVVDDLGTPAHLHVGVCMQNQSLNAAVRGSLPALRQRYGQRQLPSLLTDWRLRDGNCQHDVRTHGTDIHHVK
jgi:hypothetical protein